MRSSKKKKEDQNNRGENREIASGNGRVIKIGAGGRAARLLPAHLHVDPPPRGGLVTGGGAALPSPPAGPVRRVRRAGVSSFGSRGTNPTDFEEAPGFSGKHPRSSRGHPGNGRPAVPGGHPSPARGPGSWVGRVHELLARPGRPSAGAPGRAPEISVLETPVSSSTATTLCRCWKPGRGGRRRRPRLALLAGPVGGGGG